MNIIYISQNRIPSNKGYSIQIMKMCEAFVKQGVNLTLFTTRYKRDQVQDIKDVFKNYSIKKEFEINTIVIPFLIRFGKLGHLTQGILFSIKIYFKNSIDRNTVVYTRDWIPALLFSILGYKTYLEIHTHHGSLGSKIAQKFASGIVVISNGLKQYYIEKGIDKDKIFVSPSGVDLFDFNINGNTVDIHNELGIDKDSKIVMYTGHLYDWKGIDTLVSASEIIDKNTYIVCIGGTDHDLQKYISINNLNKNIKFIGNKPFNVIADYMRSADTFIIPNSKKSLISKSFTSPLKLFTYMAMQKPIIASDLPSIREILDDSMAYYYEPDDINSCIQAIKSSFINTKESNKKVEKSYEEVKKYSWSNRAIRLLAFLGYTNDNNEKNINHNSNI